MRSGKTHGCVCMLSVIPFSTKQYRTTLPDFKYTVAYEVLNFVVNFHISIIILNDLKIFISSKYIAIVHKQ